MNSEKLIIELNQLLSDFHIYYQNTRGFHWNIKGKRFFELHVKFEELYTEALTSIDEIAERILTIGGTPLHAFDDYGVAQRYDRGSSCFVFKGTSLLVQLRHGNSQSAVVVQSNLTDWCFLAISMVH